MVATADDSNRLLDLTFILAERVAKLVLKTPVHRVYVEAKMVDHDGGSYYRIIINNIKEMNHGNFTHFSCTVPVEALLVLRHLPGGPAA